MLALAAVTARHHTLGPTAGIFEYRADMTDVGHVYGACRERVGALVRDLSPEQAAVSVPACPDWSVHDVIAHLAGVAVDLNAGNLEGVGSEAWTAAQIEARRDTPVGGLLAEWEQASPQMEDGLRALGGTIAAMAIADTWNHEQDLRGALGLAGGHDPAAELLSLEGYAAVKAPTIAAAGLAPLRFVAGGHVVQPTEGDPGATVTGDPFELARAACARRTAGQLRGLRWEGDPEPYVAVLADGAPAAPLPC